MTERQSILHKYGEVENTFQKNRPLIGLIGLISTDLKKTKALGISLSWRQSIAREKDQSNQWSIKP